MEQNRRQDVSFVWRITDDVLRDTFKKNEIGDVMLPFVVLRRIDCILEPVNAKVRQTYKQFNEKLTPEKLEPVLRKAAGGLKFYNISSHTLSSMLDDARNIIINFNSYLNGFNKEVQGILANFQFGSTVAKINRNGLLYPMIQKISEQDFSPEKVDNHDMGYIFEELIRISNEQSNETAGEHFTPRDVIRLMSAILFTPDKEILNRKGIIRTIYDPTCGTGGMLYVGRNYIFEHICEGDNLPTINTYGQELNEQTYAIAKSESLITGEDSNNIRLGNTISDDKFPGAHFHYMMANPPYGVTWKREQKFVINESLNPNERFTAGTPRVSDGQLLFVQHMLSKMEDSGSRIGVVTNGSPLFSGGAGSGESSIRKWIIENDWLECIVALPKDLFYNTGINTYIWFLTNNKSNKRRGKVQLIDAANFCVPASKSLGNKRNDITPDNIHGILDLYMNFKESDYCKIFDNSYFGSLQITVEQPMHREDGKVKISKNGKVADPEKRDTEMVPLTMDVNEYFEKEVLPHIDPDSWIDFSKTRINYEINFTRYFYKYEKPKPSDEIAKDIINSEKRIDALMKTLFEA